MHCCQSEPAHCLLTSEHVQTCLNICLRQHSESACWPTAYTSKLAHAQLLTTWLLPGVQPTGRHARALSGHVQACLLLRQHLNFVYISVATDVLAYSRHQQATTGTALCAPFSVSVALHARHSVQFTQCSLRPANKTSCASSR